MRTDKSILYIVGTPIGNMEDMTLRSLRILKEDVSAIFCEDTRQSRKILRNYEIDLPLFSLHSHSGISAFNKALRFLEKGQNIAYLSDCGTPAISDPGSKLAQIVHENNYLVSPLPGCSALTSLVSVSGFPGKKIIFGGFLSKKAGRRINELKSLKEFKGIIVIYESPHRIIKTLNALFSVFENNDIIIGREMTKLHEEFIILNTASDLAGIENIKVKGEFSIAINNN
jgi:16S rRNA (cytidine1402-2'-O)-methyltransferase